MGLGPSRLTYDMPPPPPLVPSAEDLDISMDSPNLSDRLGDPEGYKYCRGLAIREGVYAAGLAMSVSGLAIYYTKRKAVNWRTVQALLGYSPGVLFIVSSAGLATASLFTEWTLHDCTVQRGAMLLKYWDSLGLNAVHEHEDPDRPKTTNWNVKRKNAANTSAPPAAVSTNQL